MGISKERKWQKIVIFLHVINLLIMAQESIEKTTEAGSLNPVFLHTQI